MSVADPGSERLQRNLRAPDPVGRTDTSAGGGSPGEPARRVSDGNRARAPARLLPELGWPVRLASLAGAVASAWAVKVAVLALAAQAQ